MMKLRCRKRRRARRRIKVHRTEGGVIPYSTHLNLERITHNGGETAQSQDPSGPGYFLERDRGRIPQGNAMKRDARMNPCSKGKVQMQMLKDIGGRITAGGNGIPTQDMPASAASITSWVNENQTAPASKPIELLQNCNTAIKHDPKHRSVRAVSIGVQAYQ